HAEGGAQGQAELKYAEGGVHGRAELSMLNVEPMVELKVGLS
ncbi:hypothetical protein A2U01_0109953, partial [Trifolium medium]|nr:hypothetical protein [Trifolium medium]